MKIKTEDLAHEDLAWAVAVAIGRTVKLGPGGSVMTLGRTEDLNEIEGWFVAWFPQANWLQAGPLITKYKIAIEFDPHDATYEPWSAQIDGQRYTLGNDPRVAAMRSIALAHFGQYVELPEGLQK